jgi:hypothetical protein
MTAITRVAEDRGSQPSQAELELTMQIDAAPSPQVQVRKQIRARKHLHAAPIAARSAEPAFDRDYWLAHCEGYRVDGHEGRIGFVDEVRANPADPKTPLLAVRAGMLGRHILLVSASEVHSIVPRSQHIWLRSPVTIL